MSFDLGALRDTRTVADGSWSTQLRARGLDVEIIETANLDHPGFIRALAADYLDAGARFITTNTFSANRFCFERAGVKHSVEQVNRTAAQLAKQEAAQRGAVVVGSIGPSGKIMVVREAAEDDLVAACSAQARALADGGADVILLETFSELAEVVLALKTVKQACSLPVIASMSFDSGPQRTRTMMGAEAGELAAALEEAGADMIGANCGSGIADVLPAVVALRSGCSLPLWVKPNAGLPELEDGRPVYKQTPAEFAEFVPTLFEAGANIVGGCCGTGPDHIRKIAALTG